MKLLANNKKAYHDYFIEEKYEAGLSLLGSEVKSIKKEKYPLKNLLFLIEMERCLSMVCM